MSQHEQDQPFREPQPAAIPFLSQETYQLIAEEYNLDITQKDRDMQQSMSGKAAPYTYEVAEGKITSVFGEIYQINPTFVEGLDTILTSVNDSYASRNGYYVGMALVTHAYHVNSGYDLLTRADHLGDEELAFLQSQYEKIKNFQFLDNVQQMLRSPRLPALDTYLNQLVNKTAQKTVHQQEVSNGAAIMYRTLAHAWPKLYPPQQGRHPQSPSQGK